MPEVYFGSLGENVTMPILWEELSRYPSLRSIYWETENRMRFAIVNFEDQMDALNAIRDLHGRDGWYVALQNRQRTCHQCGRRGHFAQDCSQVRGRRRLREPIHERRRRNLERRSPVRRGRGRGNN